jgi:hypothetical protein
MLLLSTLVQFKMGNQRKLEIPITQFVAPKYNRNLRSKIEIPAHFSFLFHFHSMIIYRFLKHEFVFKPNFTFPGSRLISKILNLYQKEISIDNLYIGFSFSVKNDWLIGPSHREKDKNLVSYDTWAIFKSPFVTGVTCVLLVLYLHKSFF